MRHAAQSPRPLRFDWPSPPFEVALVEPEIPANTGNIGRLCAATGTPLHLIEPLGFRLTDRHLRRAALDYWESVTLQRHASYEAFVDARPTGRRLFFTASAPRLYTAAAYAPGDILVFGCESRGLPTALLRANPNDLYGIPMQESAVRSLNLATAVAIVLYEALRQQAVAAHRAPPQAAMNERGAFMYKPG